ncbi:hypothetical protein CCH79_00011670 [Gambusia affinis]|uniref:Uncharacterized protein n=1 Tax=Gambusia affinis TaxID=33528 RepID=A0A315VW58_GAMAF|nr:hypothetical protein CCH79_00011670 [Gambusia affinis]
MEPDLFPSSLAQLQLLEVTHKGFVEKRIIGSHFSKARPRLQRGGSSASLHNSLMRNSIFQLMIHTLDPLSEGKVHYFSALYLLLTPVDLGSGADVMWPNLLTLVSYSSNFCVPSSPSSSSSSSSLPTPRHTKLVSGPSRDQRSLKDLKYILSGAIQKFDGNVIIETGSDKVKHIHFGTMNPLILQPPAHTLDTYTHSLSRLAHSRFGDSEPSIHPCTFFRFIRGRVAGVAAQNGGPDFPLPSHLFQLLWGNHEEFPGQPRDIARLEGGRALPNNDRRGKFREKASILHKIAKKKCQVEDSEKANGVASRAEKNLPNSSSVEVEVTPPMNGTAGQEGETCEKAAQIMAQATAADNFPACTPPFVAGPANDPPLPTEFHNHNPRSPAARRRWVLQARPL